MLKKLILTAAAGTALVASPAFADNGWHHGWHHYHPYVVVRPAPVVVAPYYAPAPVVVAPAAPVYAPAPAYYPAPVYAQPSLAIRLGFRL